MSDFLNWQQFAEANPDGPDTQGEAQRQALQAALDSLGQESARGAAAGGSTQLTDYGGFKQVQQQAQQAQQRYVAHQSDTWDRLAHPSASAEAVDPWSGLSQQLQGMQTGAETAGAGHDATAKARRERSAYEAQQRTQRQARSSAPAQVDKSKAAWDAYMRMTMNGGSYQQGVDAYHSAGGVGDPSMPNNTQWQNPAWDGSTAPNVWGVSQTPYTGFTGYGNNGYGYTDTTPKKGP